MAYSCSGPAWKAEEAVDWARGNAYLEHADQSLAAAIGNLSRRRGDDGEGRKSVKALALP
jgi:hypothetical protein